jgi:hypothetical protein
VFQAGRDHTLDIVKSVPDTHHLRQLNTGKATPIWLLGHLTRTMDKLVLEWTLEEPPVLAEATGIRFAPEHAGGVAPTTNLEAYPTWEELRVAYIESTDRAIAGLARLSDEDLEKPIPGAMPDAYRVRFPTIWSLLKLLTNHDAYHRGQMGLLAKLD